MEKKPPQAKSENLHEMLSELKLKTFTSLRAVKFVAPEQLRVLVALVALYRDFLEDPGLSEKVLIDNEGVNLHLFRAYYSKPNDLFKKVSATPKILAEDGIRPENVKFAKGLVGDMASLPPSSLSTAVESVQIILDYVRRFLVYYEEHFPMETKKKFYFAPRLSYAVAVDPNAETKSGKQDHHLSKSVTHSHHFEVPTSKTEFKEESQEKEQNPTFSELPSELPAKSSFQNPMKQIQRLSQNFSKNIDQFQYKRKLNIGNSASRFSEKGLGKNPLVKNYCSGKVSSRDHSVKNPSESGLISITESKRKSEQVKDPELLSNKNFAPKMTDSMGFGQKKRAASTNFAGRKSTGSIPTRKNDMIVQKSKQFPAISTKESQKPLFIASKKTENEEAKNEKANIENPESDFKINKQEYTFSVEERNQTVKQDFKTSEVINEEIENLKADSHLQYSECIENHEPNIPELKKVEILIEEKIVSKIEEKVAEIPSNPEKVDSPHSVKAIHSRKLSLPKPSQLLLLKQSPKPSSSLSKISLIRSSKSKVSIFHTLPERVEKAKSAPKNPTITTVTKKLSASKSTKTLLNKQKTSASVKKFSNEISKPSKSSICVKTPREKLTDTTKSKSKEKSKKQSIEKSKEKVIVPLNNSITMNAQSVVKNYIEHSEVRERYIAEEKNIGKEKIEINKLRMEASHFKFLIEKEANHKIREEMASKRKDSNYFKDFNDKYKNFVVEKQKEDKEFIRKIKNEAKEDLKQSKRAKELQAEAKEIMLKVELAQKKQNEFAQLMETSPKIVGKEDLLGKTDEQLRKEFSEIKKEIEVKNLEKTKSSLKSEVGYLKSLIGRPTS